MSTIVVGLPWQPYLRPSFVARPTTKDRGFAPPITVASGELSRAAKEPKLFALHTKLDQIASLCERLGWARERSARSVGNRKCATIS